MPDLWYSARRWLADRLVPPVVAPSWPPPSMQPTHVRIFNRQSRARSGARLGGALLSIPHAAFVEMPSLQQLIVVQRAGPGSVDVISVGQPLSEAAIAAI